MTLIDQGHIRTWSYDKDGDFTHDTDQWRRKAWFRPRIEGDTLVFSVIRPLNGHVSREVYGIYHGRFTEAILVHCADLLSACESSAFAVPALGDFV